MTTETSSNTPEPPLPGARRYMERVQELLQTVAATQGEAIAAAAGLALFTLRRAVAAGKIPPADITLHGTPQPVHAWKLSTLRAWNPAVADRCAAILRALETIPLDAA